MYDTDFLKTITVLYVEDDIEARESLEIILRKIFKNTIVVSNGIKALDTYERSLKLKKENHIDIIISDINMPDMNGIDLLKSIRSLNKDIPFIFTTGHSNHEYLLDAIKNDISDYLVKPIQTQELITHIQKVCKTIYEHKLAIHSHNEAKGYLNIIDQVAIITKTDTKGNITYANDIFCEIAGYTREELIGSNHRILRHPDMLKISFDDLWNTIRSGKTWKGKVRNKAKDGSSYIVNATIFPIYDELDEKIIGYMAVRFLITDEENQKKEFKIQVRELVAKYKMEIKELKENKDKPEIKFRKTDHEFLEHKFKREKDKSTQLVTQINHYEETIKNHEIDILEQRSMTKRKLSKFHTATKSLLEKNKILNDKLNILEQNLILAQKEIEKQSHSYIEQSTRLIELEDIIEHQDHKLR